MLICLIFPTHRLNWVVWMGNTRRALLHLNFQGYRWVCPCSLSSELLGPAPMPCTISPAGLPVPSRVTALTARLAQPYPDTHSSSGHPWSCPLGLDRLSLFGSLWEPAQLSLCWMRSTAKQSEERCSLGFHSPFHIHGQDPSHCRSVSLPDWMFL